MTWDESAGASLDSEALLAQYRELATQPGTPFAKPAATTAPAPAVAKTVEAVYEFPFLAHAPMEPQSCVAWLHDGMLETWAGHQFPTFDHQLAAKAAGLPLDKVKLHTLDLGRQLRPPRQRVERLHGGRGQRGRRDQGPRAGAPAVHAARTT